MRWLALKDLQILRRSPLLVALLIIYPIVIAVLFGLALSGGPDKPRVAFANLVPQGDSTFRVGGRTLDVKSYAGRLFDSVPGLVQRHAILLTDGENHNETPEQLTNAIMGVTGKFQCDCRGVGVDWQVAEVRRIAQALLGSVDIIPEPDQMS